MMNGIMEHISSSLQHEGGNCLDISLTLATDCQQEKERCTIASSNIRTRYDDAEETVRSTMKRQTAVSFLEWGNKDEYRVLDPKNGEKDMDLERMGSGMSSLSDGSGDDPRKLSPWGVQRIWLDTFDNVAKPYDVTPMFRGRNAVPVHDFKPAEQVPKVAVKVEEVKQEKFSHGVEQSGGEDGKKRPSREHMFDKAVTPSDVGKLNRLVIPKQHAEKFFPLDTNANEKGLLLNFEDNLGKAWRFRYSYWNSSQSYVLTKGWSRFVKEKKLYAGDIVSFERGTDQNTHRLFISWRRRPPVQTTFADPSTALLTRPHIQYRPFQPHALNMSGAAVGRPAQLQGSVIPACSKVFPQWMSLVWPANGGGASSRAAEMWAPGRAVAEHHQMDPYFPSYKSPADRTEMTRVPLNFTELSPPERSQADVLWPVESKPGTGFDPSTSKKGVRLFGVNL